MNCCKIALRPTQSTQSLPQKTRLPRQHPMSSYPRKIHVQYLQGVLPGDVFIWIFLEYSLTMSYRYLGIICIVMDFRNKRISTPSFLETSTNNFQSLIKGVQKHSFKTLLFGKRPLHAHFFPFIVTVIV